MLLARALLGQSPILPDLGHQASGSPPSPDLPAVPTQNHFLDYLIAAYARHVLLHLADS